MSNQGLDEKCLLKACIYYVKATKKHNTLDRIMALLEYDKVEMDNCIKKLTYKQSSSSTFYQLSNSEYKNYDDIKNILMKKVEKEQKNNNYIPDFCNEVELDLYAEKIIKKINIVKFADYIVYLKNHKDPRGIFAYGYRLCYTGENIEQGISYIKESNSMGLTISNFYLGELYFNGKMYSNGTKIEKNYSLAEEYLEKFLQEEGLNYEMYNNEIITTRNDLGEIYYCGGYGYKQNYQLAYGVLHTMREVDLNKYSVCYLGSMFFDGLGCNKDKEIGFRLLKKAAEQNVVAAQEKMIQAYGQGIGTKEDLEKSLYWAERAVSNDSSGAKYFLGIAFYYSDGTYNIKQDKNYGLKLLKEAANSGVKPAIDELKLIEKKEEKYNEPDELDYEDDRRHKQNWFWN